MPAVGDDELDIAPPWLRFRLNKFVKIRVWVPDDLEPVYIRRTSTSVILYVQTVIVTVFLHLFSAMGAVSGTSCK